MANLITVLRTLLAFFAVAMLRWHTWEIYVGAALLTLLLIWMDAWDGWVARRRNEASKAGAVFDILGDRVVEMTYWIAFASFGWIPVWVAVLVSARGIVVDGFRALALGSAAGMDLGPMTLLTRCWTLFGNISPVAEYHSRESFRPPTTEPPPWPT